MEASSLNPSARSRVFGFEMTGFGRVVRAPDVGPSGVSKAERPLPGVGDVLAEA